MKALKESCFNETSGSVLRAYAGAYAILSQYVGKTKLDKDVDSWLDAIQRDESSVNSAIVSGILLKALAFESSDMFARYADDIAPVAYIAQLDSEEQKSKIWMEVWEECIAVTGSGIRGNAKSIMELALEMLKSSQWSRKKSAGKALVTLFDSASDILIADFPRILRALLDDIPGKIWDGKEILLTSLGAAVKSTGEKCFNDFGDLKAAILEALINAATKKKHPYRKEALRQLCNGTE